MDPIATVAERLRLPADRLIPFGRFKAKLPLELLDEPRASRERAKLVLVSAITPTPAGEGKTSTAIGLADALSRRDLSICATLREPSMGPCMGIKGGGTGGGQSQLVPSDDINLHFNGDFHAITAAHNLMAAVVDNHLHFGSDVGLDPRRILWRRVLDMNDRALRNVATGFGGPAHGMPRETGFDITAASELMAILSLADGYDDLRARLDRILVGFTRAREPVTARSLEVTGAMTALLKDALMPNLVQTRHGTPAFVHGGPFANIAHGCNSVLATKMGMQLCDWVVTEAGFGSDLGAEKFFDIKCRSAGIDPAAVVIVATVRALKLHGGQPLAELGTPDPAAVEAGLPNLGQHIENIGTFGKPAVVVVNRFPTDVDEEISVIRAYCEERSVPVAVGEHFERGPEGAADLAKIVVETAEAGSAPFTPVYDLDAAVPDKVSAIARKIYGARGVRFEKTAQRDIAEIERLGYAGLPVCVAKTQSSLSDDPKLRGRPRDFDVTVRRIQINAGAGFLVVLTGDIIRMPGLPKVPQSTKIDLVEGKIVGLR